ncbi:MAG: TetR/AcrR family transcriptional regulator [Ilumatobacteraceae bacterium]
MSAQPPKTASHRPSRRGVIVDAAIKVFSSQGFADAKVHDIAQEAGVAPTAVYYHFDGKPDLFEAALRQVLGSITELVLATRPDDEPGSPDGLSAVISAVWSWLDDNPEACQLLHHHLPGMTTRAVTLQREFEDRHVSRAFDYIPRRALPATRRSAIGRHAAEVLAARTLIGLTVLIHSMRSQDGPLAGRADRRVREALIDVCQRLLAG